MDQTTRRPKRADTWSGIEAVRVRELSRIYLHRWGTTLPDDDAGRDDATLYLAHVTHLRNGQQRACNFLDLFCPWMGKDEREVLLADAARGGGIFWSADDLAAKLGLTYAERTARAITTIGSIDVDKDGRARLRAERKRKRELERRQSKRAAKVGAAAASEANADLSEKDAAVYAQLGAGWMGTGAIARGLKNIFGRIDERSARRAINRALATLVAKGLVEEKMPSAKRGLPMRLVRRLTC